DFPFVPAEALGERRGGRVKHGLEGHAEPARDEVAEVRGQPAYGSIRVDDHVSRVAAVEAYPEFSRGCDVSVHAAIFVVSRTCLNSKLATEITENTEEP